jgi:hypothetical protein
MEGGWIELGGHALGLVNTPDQQKATRLEIPCLSGIHPVAMVFEHLARGIQRPCGPSQLACNERNLGLGDNTPCSRDDLLRTEGPSSPSQQTLRSTELSELRHCNPTQRESGRVIAQSDTLQRGQRITRRQGAPRGSNQ